VVGLPAAATATAASTATATTIAAVTTATTAAAVSTAASTAAVSAAASAKPTSTAATTTTTAATAAGALARLTDADGATLHVASVQGIHGRGRLGVRRHFDKGKAARAASVAIEDHSDFLDVSTLCEDLAQIRFGHAVGQISDV
jgi:hypothetical protein